MLGRKSAAPALLLAAATLASSLHAGSQPFLGDPYPAALAWLLHLIGVDLPRALPGMW